MQTPMPAGTPGGSPVRLPAEVAGALSRMQGQMMAVMPDVQNAYARHWLAAREVDGQPAFEQFTQPMLQGLYGYTALGGLLRMALSGRGTPDVMAGIIDQVNLIQQSYGQAAAQLRQFMDTDEAREFPSVQPMVRSFTPLDRVYNAVQQPMQTITQGVGWMPGPPAPFGLPIRMAQIGGTPAPGAEGERAPEAP